MKKNSIIKFSWSICMCDRFDIMWMQTHTHRHKMAFEDARKVANVYNSGFFFVCLFVFRWVRSSQICWHWMYFTVFLIRSNDYSKKKHLISKLHAHQKLMASQNVHHSNCVLNFQHYRQYASWNNILYKQKCVPCCCCFLSLKLIVIFDLCMFFFCLCRSFLHQTERVGE